MKSVKIDFSDKKVFDQLTAECYAGTLAYSQFPACEYKYFSKLDKICGDYKLGIISKEEANKRNAIILRDYRADKVDMGRIACVYAEYQDNIRKAGALRSDIDKAKTVEDKLRYCLECIEAMTGETGFARRNLNALHNEADTTDKP